MNNEKKREKKRQDILKISMSKDATRQFICNKVKHCKVLQGLVATTGFQACILGSYYSEKLADISIDVKTMQYSELDFPKVSSVIPTSFTTCDFVPEQTIFSLNLICKKIIRGYLFMKDYKLYCGLTDESYDLPCIGKIDLVKLKPLLDGGTYTVRVPKLGYSNEINSCLVFDIHSLSNNFYDQYILMPIIG